jgi:hypothetical protein
MKNKETYSVKQMTDKLQELCTAKYPKDTSMKWAYIAGVLESILDWEVKGYNKGYQTLQDEINNAYLRYDEELKGLLAAS